MDFLTRTFLAVAFSISNKERKRTSFAGSQMQPAAGLRVSRSFSASLPMLAPRSDPSRVALQSPSLEKRPELLKP